MNSNDFKWFQTIANKFKWFHMVSYYFKRFQIISNDFKWFQMISHDFKGLLMISMTSSDFNLSSDFLWHVIVFLANDMYKHIEFNWIVFDTQSINTYAKPQMAIYSQLLCNKTYLVNKPTFQFVGGGNLRWTPPEGGLHTPCWHQQMGK